MDSMPIVFGRYRLLARLESDGEIDVFRGALPGLGGYERPVVIRMLSDPKRAGSDGIRRFFARARTAAEIQHPNVVQVFEVGSGPNGEAFMVEGWVPGPSLSALSGRVRDAGIRWPTWLTLHVATEVLAALVHCEERGIWHGAMTDSTIRLSYDGEVRVNGFGQQTPAHDERDLLGLLKTSMGLGSDPSELEPPIRQWLANGSAPDLLTCHRWVMHGRIALKARVTLVDVASAISALESDLQERSDPVPVAPPMRAGYEPRSGRARPRTGSVRPISAVPREPESRPASRLRRRPRSSAANPILRPVPSGAPVSSSRPSFPLDAVPAAGPRRAVVHAAGRAAGSEPGPDVLSVEDWADLKDPEPTEPSRPPLQLSPTMEITPGRRGDVRVWLEVPPAIVGPRKLADGLRLVRELGLQSCTLSVSVDGRRFRRLERIAQLLSEPLPSVERLDESAPVKGTLNERSSFQVLAELGRTEASGRLTFARHEPETPERLVFDVEDGRLVGAAASAMPLASWSCLLEDADLPAGMAARAFSMVVSAELPLVEVSSPLLMTALTQARAVLAERYLDTVLEWNWARYAFVPGVSPRPQDRVTDVALLPALFERCAREDNAVLFARVSPLLGQPMHRTEDYRTVVSRLRLHPNLMAFTGRLGDGMAPRDALVHGIDPVNEAQALALIDLLHQMEVLIPTP